MRSIKEDLTLRRLDGARTDAPQCLKGKPCGNRCIPRDQECHEGGPSPLKEFDNRFKKLSRTEKLAIGGVGAIGLANAVALPLLVRPTGRAVVEGAGEALSKNRKGVDEFIAKQSTTAASNAATSASETFNRLNKEGAFNETYQNLGSNIVEGGLSEKNINAAMRNIQNAVNEGILSEKNINQTLRNLQLAGNRRVEVQRRLNRRVASRDTKRVQQAMSNLEPQFAKTFKKRLGIKSDSYEYRRPRIDAQMKCGPGSKPCKGVCIPRAHNCSTSSAAEATANRNQNLRTAAVLAGAGGLYLYAKHRHRKGLESAKQNVGEWQRKWQSGDRKGFSTDPVGDAKAEERMRAALGLKKGATADEAKKQYRNWAKKNHPDMGGDKSIFQDVSAAYNRVFRGDSYIVWAEGF